MSKAVPLSRRQKRRNRNWAGVVVAVVVIYFFYSFARLGLALYQTNLQIAEGKARQEALLTERERLQKEIQELNQDSYIERVAREELGLVKPGETVLIPAVPGQVRPLVPPTPGHEFRD